MLVFFMRPRIGISRVEGDAACAVAGGAPRRSEDGQSYGARYAKRREQVRVDVAEQEPQVRPLHQLARLPGRDGRYAGDAQDEHEDGEDPQAQHQTREPWVYV